MQTASRIIIGNTICSVVASLAFMIAKGLLKVRLTPSLWGRGFPAWEDVDMPAAHPKEFRDDVVAVTRRGEAPIARLAKDFGISESCLRNWLHRADVEDGVRPG